MKDLKSQGTQMNSAEGTKMNSAESPARGKRPGGLNNEIQSRIGHQLRAMYDDVVRQGVPDRFADLIRQLDEPSQKPPGKTEGLE